VTLMVGPEGGFDPEEERAARRAGFQPVSLGPRVLRTETAGLAAIAAIMTLWGDF
jgi:16S rRNA (uracil1498-N3)-methyltransferase